MNGEQFFQLLGELDEALVTAAAKPPVQRQPVRIWLLIAAAAVVIGIIGYAALLRAWQSPPAVEPPVAGTTVTTSEISIEAVSTTTAADEGAHQTVATTEKMPTAVTTTIKLIASATAPVTDTTSSSFTTHMSTDVSVKKTTARRSTTTTIGTSFVTSVAKTTSTTVGDRTTPSPTQQPTGPDTVIIPSTTIASSSAYHGTTTTVAVTQGTMPNGLPVLNSDYEVETDRVNGYVEFVFGYSFEELQVQSIATAPSVLPVYVVTEESYQETSLPVIVQNYAALVGDTLNRLDMDGHMVGDTADGPLVANSGTSAYAVGERFRYHLNRGEGNYLMLALLEPIELGTPDQWLSQAMAYCPALFQDMKVPTLHRWNGSRWWNQEHSDTPATVQEQVSFYARIYDAAEDSDGTARWLNGVSLKIEDGKLTAYCVMFEENYQKLGDYPILSVAEATALAREQCETLKNYPYYSIISEDYEILSTELVYMPHSASELRVPLYRFLVTTDGADYLSQLRAETGMTMYYAVYVTAVPPSYWTSESRDRFITQQ